MVNSRDNTIAEKDSFNRQINDLFSEVDLNITEYARLLEAESRIIITPVKLTGWLKRNVAPKTDEERAKVLAAAERVNKLLQQGIEDAGVSESRWVSGLEVRQQILAWYAQGLSPKQVYQAGEINATQLAVWEKGQSARVERVRFDRVVLLVTHWLELLTNSGSLLKCPGALVQSQLKNWQSQGLTLDEIRAAGEISPALFKAWLASEPVPQVHFDRVYMMVSHWVKTKAAWQADPSRAAPAKGLNLDSPRK
jgi:hypothetical protein